MMMRSLWHHLIPRLVLCWVMPRKSRRCLRVRKLRLNSLKPPALRTKSCWRLWNAPRRGFTCRGRKTKIAAPPGRLDERYLSGHKPPAQVSLPFLPDLHTEVEREWKKPFSSRIHRFQHTSYANIARMRESGYERMPSVEETLASYFSMGDTASLMVPSLPFKPLQDTSRLNYRAYAAAGQAVASLHTMAVLQAYQADLLKDPDNGQGLSPDEVAELRRTTDLALRATKQAATAMGRSMSAMMVMDRHLWVNLADLEKKEKGFLLDAPISPSELFGTSIETVIEKFREARACSAAFETFIPRRSRSEPDKAGVLARPGLRIGDRHRRLVSRLVPLPHLRVGLEGGTGQGEVGETWGSWSRRSVLNNTLVRTGVKNSYLLPSLGSRSYHRPLASPLQFPCNHHLRHLTEVRWEPRLQSDRPYDDFGQVLCSSKLPYWWSGPEVSSEVSVELPWSSGYSGLQIPGNPIGPYQADLFMRLLVEPALLPSP